MVCIHCGAETQVVNSRPQKRTNQIWRRRLCNGCGSSFTTQESALYGLAWVVESRSGLPLPFSRDKLFLSLYRSLEHRQSALKDAAALTDTVTAKLRGHVKDARLSSQAISQVAQVALNRFDKAASVHYRAFHGRRS